MRIYTKTGDSGETGLLGGDRVRKDSLRIQAIGEIDELNSALGLASCAQGDTHFSPTLPSLQSLLFDLGSEIACPPGGKFHLETIRMEDVSELETAIDAMSGGLPELKNFILPGGTELAARLHLARSVCRRAERALVTLGEEAEVRPTVLEFINRLSDWLFTAARTANASQNVQDVPWIPASRG
jgi:cob(I)alamin adenosyltransferase